MKRTVAFLTCLALVGCTRVAATADAEGASSEPAAASSTAAASLDLTPFIAEVDKNHDGCMSDAEWFGLGLPASANKMLRDPKGCVTLETMTKTAAPADIDLNKDGKLTVAEFLAFDKKGPPGGSSGAPPPPKP